MRRAHIPSTVPTREQSRAFMRELFGGVPEVKRALTLPSGTPVLLDTESGLQVMRVSRSGFEDLTGRGRWILHGQRPDKTANDAVLTRTDVGTPGSVTLTVTHARQHALTPLLGRMEAALGRDLPLARQRPDVDALRVTFGRVDATLRAEGLYVDDVLIAAVRPHSEMIIIDAAAAEATLLRP